MDCPGRESPSLEVFEEKLDVTLSAMAWLTWPGGVLSQVGVHDLTGLSNLMDCVIYKDTVTTLYSLEKHLGCEGTPGPNSPFGPDRPKALGPVFLLYCCKTSPAAQQPGVRGWPGHGVLAGSRWCAGGAVPGPAEERRRIGPAGRSGPGAPRAMAAFLPPVTCPGGAAALLRGQARPGHRQPWARPALSHLRQGTGAWLCLTRGQAQGLSLTPARAAQ